MLAFHFQDPVNQFDAYPPQLLNSSITSSTRVLFLGHRHWVLLAVTICSNHLGAQFSLQNVSARVPEKPMSYQASRIPECEL